MGGHFRSDVADGSTCGQGSCDNPVWPWLRWCVRGRISCAGEQRSSCIHWVTNKIIQEQALCILIFPFNCEVVLKDKLSIYMCIFNSLSRENSQLCLGRCLLDIGSQACSRAEFSWIRTTDRDDTAQFGKSWCKAKHCWKNINQNKKHSLEPAWTIDLHISFWLSVWHLTWFALCSF